MHKQRLLFIVLAWFATCGIYAQVSGGNSPYSRYGWGTLQQESSGFNKGMGGVGIALQYGDRLNSLNPASYSALDSITFLFDAGISLQKGTFKENGTSVTAQGSTLDYLQAGFRLRKGLGVSVGMSPISIISYNFLATENMTNIDGYGAYTSSQNFKGQGGVNKGRVGLGWEPVKNLSLGANVNYIWGSIDNNSSRTYSNTSIYSIARKYTANISTFGTDFGAQFVLPINKAKKEYINIGATYGVGHKFNSTATYIEQKLNSSSTAISADTLYATNPFSLPSTWGIGIAYSKNNQWTIGLDYSTQLWKKCDFPALYTLSNGDRVYAASNNAFRNSHHVALGAEYIPNPEGLKVRHHVAYRAGVSYTSSYINTNNHSGPSTLILSAGMGLPIVNMYNNRSVLNVALQWEHIGGGNNALKEDHLRLCLGLSFNAIWFNKWKIE